MKERVREWKRGFERGSTDEMFATYLMCKEFHWTWQDAMACPERTYQSFVRLSSLRGKHELRKADERKAANEAKIAAMRSHKRPNG